jgi:hypothetical protein
MVVTLDLPGFRALFFQPFLHISAKLMRGTWGARPRWTILSASYTHRLMQVGDATMAGGKLNGEFWNFRTAVSMAITHQEDP